MTILSSLVMDFLINHIMQAWMDLPAGLGGATRPNTFVQFGKICNSFVSFGRFCNTFKPFSKLQNFDCFLALQLLF